MWNNVYQKIENLFNIICEIRMTNWITYYDEPFNFNIKYFNINELDYLISTINTLGLTKVPIKIKNMPEDICGGY